MFLAEVDGATWGDKQYSLSVGGVVVAWMSVTHWAVVSVGIVTVYLLRIGWRILLGDTMKKLRGCCCFWRPKEDQYKLVAGDQELITIRPKVYLTCRWQCFEC